MKITPLRNMVLVKLDEATERPAASGLVLVELAKQPSVFATVEAIGSEVRDVVMGRRVVVSRLQGIEMPGERVLLPEAAVLEQEPGTQADGAEA